MRMQAICQDWAEKFNAGIATSKTQQIPPKRSSMPPLGCSNFLREQTSRTKWVSRLTFKIAHIEEALDGEWMKYNNNTGMVFHPQRKTPQAFSHFTYERSDHNLISVDIQGTEADNMDLYTDPQIHTEDGGLVGVGNLKKRGMTSILSS